MLWRPYAECFQTLWDIYFKSSDQKWICIVNECWFAPTRSAHSKLQQTISIWNTVGQTLTVVHNISALAILNYLVVLCLRTILFIYERERFSCLESRVFDYSLGRSFRCFWGSSSRAGPEMEHWLLAWHHTTFRAAHNCCGCRRELCIFEQFNIYQNPFSGIYADGLASHLMCLHNFFSSFMCICAMCVTIYITLLCLLEHNIESVVDRLIVF